MPREFIIFRHDFEESGETARWRDEYLKLNGWQRKRLLELVSLPVKELRITECPAEFKSILPFYLIKHKQAKKMQEDEDQLSIYDEN